MSATFAASHKICIRYLKGEHADVQLMYLGGVSVLGSAVLCIIAQQWTLPATTAEFLLLLLTGKNVWCFMTTLHNIPNGSSFTLAAVVHHRVSCAGCAAYGSQKSQTIALKMVEASLATAMSYLSVVWGILSGYLVFHEVCCNACYKICKCTANASCH